MLADDRGARRPAGVSRGDRGDRGRHRPVKDLVVRGDPRRVEEGRDRAEGVGEAFGGEAGRADRRARGEPADRGLERRPRERVSPSRGTRLGHVGDGVADVVADPERARLEDAAAAEREVAAGCDVGEGVRDVDVFAAAGRLDRPRHEVEPRTPAGRDPAAARSAVVERGAGADERDLGEAREIVFRARRTRGELDDRRRALADRRRAGAGKEEGGPDGVRVDAAEDADAMKRVEERETVVRHARVAPRRAAGPEFGRVVVPGRHAGDPLERAEEVALAERHGVDHVVAGDRADVAREPARLALVLERDALVAMGEKRGPHRGCGRGRQDHLDRLHRDGVDDEPHRNARRRAAADVDFDRGGLIGVAADAETVGAAGEVAKHVATAARGGGGPHGADRPRGPVRAEDAARERLEDDDRALDRLARSRVDDGARDCAGGGILGCRRTDGHGKRLDKGQGYEHSGIGHCVSSGHRTSGASGF